MRRGPTRPSSGARSFLPGDAPTAYIRHSARSAPAGLLEIAEKHDARLIVLGSSSAGVFGHIALGSVTDRLLHSSHVSLALATRGFRCPGDQTVARVTAGFGGTESAEDLVLAAATIELTWAHRCGSRRSPCGPGRRTRPGWAPTPRMW